MSCSAEIEKGRVSNPPLRDSRVLRVGTQRYAPLRFFSSSINCGATLKGSPTTPQSDATLITAFPHPPYRPSKCKWEFRACALFCARLSPRGAAHDLRQRKTPLFPFSP